MSIDTTALLAKVCWKLQVIKEEVRLHISSIMWPIRVWHDSFVLIAFMIRRQFPSNITLNKLSSLANATTQDAVSALACSID